MIGGDNDLRQRRAGCRGAADPRWRRERLTVNVTVAQHIAQAELVVEAMVKAERGDIDPGGLGVFIGQAIEVPSVYIWRLPEEERQAIVGMLSSCCTK